jgi:predicted nucleic acid-binding Zn ribbon protein
MNSLKYLLSGAAERAGIGKQLEASAVVEIAAEIFKVEFPGLDDRLKPLYLKNKTLTVSCASSTIAQELKLRETALVHTINERLGYSGVDRIRYLC